MCKRSLSIIARLQERWTQIEATAIETTRPGIGQSSTFEVSGGSFSVEYELREHPLAHGETPVSLDTPVPTEADLPVALHASTAIVTYDFEAARPRRLTAEEREVLGRYVGDPVVFRR